MKKPKKLYGSNLLLVQSPVTGKTISINLRDMDPAILKYFAGQAIKAYIWDNMYSDTQHLRNTPEYVEAKEKAFQKYCSEFVVVKGE
jgi:hypothetical protein